MGKVKTQTKEQHHLNLNFKNSVSLMSIIFGRDIDYLHHSTRFVFIPLTYVVISVLVKLANARFVLSIELRNFSRVIKVNQEDVCSFDVATGVWKKPWFFVFSDILQHARIKVTVEGY